MEDICGIRSGMLIVVGRAGNDKNGNSTWNCICDCGSMTTKTGTSLRSGSAKSCGCIRKKNQGVTDGARFGRWTVLVSVLSKKDRTCLCVCDCGNKRVVLVPNLASGASMSCGCLIVDTHTKHGKSTTPEYRAWNAMRQRCSPAMMHNNYAGRGITICDRWQSFEAFLADMGPRPAGTSIDRIDNDGNYEPGNCRWADSKTQARNRRTNRMVTISGETMTLIEASERYSVSIYMLGDDIRKKGLSAEESILRIRGSLKPTEAEGSTM